MVEGWIIFRTPNYPFTVRKFYGHGPSRVFVQGDATRYAATIEAARAVIPRGLGLRRARSKEQDVEEVWLSQSSLDTIRRRLAAR